MTVFVSHKQEDTSAAQLVAERLESHPDVAAYLDVMDPHLEQAGDDLGDYLRGVLGRCTHLMATVSERTRASWWVPFEIGLATEKGYPISTFAIENCHLPEYLRKWPYLRSLRDIDVYVAIALRTEPVMLREGLQRAARHRVAAYSRRFHLDLKRALGQEGGLR